MATLSFGDIAVFDTTVEMITTCEHMATLVTFEKAAILAIGKIARETKKLRQAFMHDFPISSTKENPSGNEAATRRVRLIQNDYPV